MKSIIEISDVLKFYETHSNATTCKEFHISAKRLKKILLENNVPIRSKAENTKLTNLEKYGVEHTSQLKEIVLLQAFATNFA